MSKKIEDEINSKESVLVLFYATWCPFCQSFLPIFEEYTKGGKQECMKVIMDDREDLCDKYSIEYYPTVILFKKGKISKRLNSEPGIGLNKKKLDGFAKSL
jgi:thioredoxin 1